MGDGLSEFVYTPTTTQGSVGSQPLHDKSFFQNSVIRARKREGTSVIRHYFLSDIPPQIDSADNPCGHNSGCVAR